MKPRDPIARSITSARWRLFVQEWQSVLGGLCLLGLSIGAGLLLADRLLAVPIPLWLYLTLVGTLFVVAPVVAWRRWPSREATAEIVDQRLALKDRLATALFATSMPDNPFAEHVVRDAQRSATKLPIASAFSLRLSRHWAYVPPLIAVVVLAFMFIPQLDLLGRAQAQSQKQAQQDQAQNVKDQVEQALAAIERVEMSQPQSDDQQSPLDPDQALDELAQITQGDLTSLEARQETAVKLSQLQDRLADQIQRQQESMESLQNTMSRLEDPPPGPADQFVDALRRGDFQAAQQAMQELAQSIESMPEADRQALAQQLENLAQQLQQAAQQHAQQQAQSQQQMNELLQNAGLTDQQIQQLQQQGANSQALQQQLTQQGMTPQQAQQVAQQLQQLQQQQQSQGQNSQMSQNMASSLKNQAGQCTNNNSPTSQPTHQPGNPLSQLAQMQQQLQQMQTAGQQAQQAQQAIGGLNNNQSGGPGGTGGHEAGTAEGGNPSGLERRIGPYQTHAKDDAHQGQGRVIASWQSDGEAVKGEPTVGFDQAVLEARRDAEQAVTEDRVPRRYHETVRQYFNQMPETVEQIKTPPPAPR